MPDTTQRLLELALKGLEAEKVKIEVEISQIRQRLNLPATEIGNGTAGTMKKRRTMSAAARKKISQSMKRRYAELRKAIAKRG
jgi:hypothetical protein